MIQTQTAAESLGFVHRFSVAQQTDAPTLLLLHGTGGNENDLLGLGRALHPQAALLSPRGKVLERGMVPRFFRRLAEGVFDMEDLQQRTHELADFVGAAADVYGFDAGRVVAVGYSNGANIAASTLLLRPGVLSAAVLLRPMVPLVPATLPDLSGTRVFIAAGQHDPIVTPAQSEKLALLLQSAGAEVALRWHAGGHALASEEVQAAADGL
jgi:phospholipase/carboxylesterase/glyoxalase family protein